MITSRKGQVGHSRISGGYTTGSQSNGGGKATFPDLKHTKSILQNKLNLAHLTRLHFWHFGRSRDSLAGPDAAPLAGTLFQRFGSGRAQRNQLRTHGRHHRHCRRRRRPRPRQKGIFFAPIRLVRRQDLFDNRKTFQNGCKWLELETDHDGNGCLRYCV